MELDEIIRMIAKENGVTPEEVYREMQDCINDAYNRAPKGSAAKRKQDGVPRKGEIPTPEELIAYLASQLNATGTGIQ